jgi:hypothetical protein
VVDTIPQWSKMSLRCPLRVRIQLRGEEGVEGREEANDYYLDLVEKKKQYMMI